METPSRHSFDCDGSTRVFPIPSYIKGDNFIRVDVDGVIINDHSKYDIVNNAIVFIDAADVPAGVVLDVLVVQSAEAIGQLGAVNSLDIVAEAIANVNTVGTNIADVNTVADNMSDINTVEDNIANVNTVAGIDGDVTTVAGISSDVTTVANGINSNSYNNTDWDTAYSWGDHSTEGYITSLADDTSPELGGHLRSNGHNIHLDNNNYIKTWENGYNQNGLVSILTPSHLSIGAKSGSLFPTSTYRTFDGLTFEHTAALLGADGIYFQLDHSNADVRFFGEDSEGTRVVRLEWQGDTEQLEFGDGVKAVFGDDADFQIYHDSAMSHTYLKESGAGSLIVEAQDLIINNADATQHMIYASAGGAVSLYHAGNLKLQTNTTGATFTGTLTDGSDSTYYLNLSGSSLVEFFDVAYGLTVGTTASIGSDLTVTGTITASGYNDSDWNTAYGWGDHSTAGYLTSETSHSDVLVDGDFTSSGFMTTDGAGNYSVDTSTYLTSFDVVDDQSPELGGDLNTNAYQINVGNTTGSKLAITNDGSNSTLASGGTTNLILNAGNYINLEADGQTAATLQGDDDSTFYHTGTARLTIQSTGIDVNGDVGGDTLSISGNGTVGGNLTVTGNLQVDGTTTTVNSTTLDVADLNITVAKGAANADAANGAGLTVDGASATIIYNSTDDDWEFNKGLDVTGDIVVSGTVDGVDIQTLNTTAGSALQNLVEDTSPELGGNLDLNSNNIVGLGQISISGNTTAQDELVTRLEFKDQAATSNGDYGKVRLDVVGRPGSVFTTNFPDLYIRQYVSGTTDGMRDRMQFDGDTGYIKLFDADGDATFTYDNEGRIETTQQVKTHGGFYTDQEGDNTTNVGYLVATNNLLQVGSSSGAKPVAFMVGNLEKARLTSTAFNAPNLYDFNDTTYYLDPASTSTSLKIAGDIVAGGYVNALGLSVDGGSIKLNGNYPVGTGNVALGTSALGAVITGGNYNTAIGYNALPANTTGDDNVAIGVSVMKYNTTGSDNVAIGNNAMRDNTTGQYNVAVGRWALINNTTGWQNVAVGDQALQNTETGERNSAVGLSALANNTSGRYNSALGGLALILSSTGDSNTAVGYGSGYYITGSKNTIIGRFDGNQNGLDIRTSDNNIVLSDGDGNPRLHIDSSGNTTFSGDLTINKTGSAGITINADTDNVTETDLPFLKFTQDGGIGQLTVGVDNNKPYIYPNRTDNATQSADVNQLWLKYKDGSFQQMFHDGYHPNSDKWTTARTLSLTGDVTGSVSWDGSGNASMSTTVANDSHTHDGRYYTESEMQTFFRRGYIESHSASNLAAGWYTIATNTGNRALGEFQIWDTASSDHQSVLFNASHHFGADNSNDITVLAQSRYNGTNFRYIRIKDNGTFDGAALQVYIDAASNQVNVAITGANAQTSGWVLKDWIADATDPGDVDNYSSFTGQCQVDLDLTVNGGMMTTGNIYAGGAFSQYRVLTTNDEGSGNGLDADKLDGQHASAFAAASHTHNYLSTSGGTLAGVLNIEPSNTSGVQTGINLYDAGGGSSEGIKINWYSSSDANTASIYGNSYDQLRFQTAGTDRVTINSAGHLGIGTTTPTAKLHIETDSSPTVKLVDTTNNCTLLAYAQDSGAIVGTYSNHYLGFATNSTERIRIDSSGNTTFYNQVIFNDDVWCSFGNSQDLSIYHQASTSNSVIQNTTGSLDIVNLANDNDIRLRSDDGSGGVTDYILCDGSTGNVYLNRYGSTKLQTLASGVYVIGTMQASEAVTVNGIDTRAQAMVMANLFG